MKNHVFRNSQLIQTNKKFSQLKQSQKEWIAQRLREKYIDSCKDTAKKPSNQVRDNILYEVYSEIEEKGIWIPYEEVKKYYYSKISPFLKSANI